MGTITDTAKLKSKLFTASVTIEEGFTAGPLKGMICIHLHQSLARIPEPWMHHHFQYWNKEIRLPENDGRARYRQLVRAMYERFYERL